MLAGRRGIQTPVELVRTPLLVPSFSSKSDTDWNVRDEVDVMKEHIATPVLMSAYDLHYRHVDLPTFPSLLFLDSGGYEAHRDFQAAERRDEKSMLEKQPWSRDLHEKVLEGLQTASPIVAVTYDHPGERLGIDRQIEEASAFGWTGILKEILLKPAPAQTFLAIDEVIDRLDDLAQFSVIGLTDKELGASMRDRLVAVARLRKAMHLRGIETPIHVFGSLDPITSPLYFLAGADIFDGLAWLRYALDENGTTYMQNFGVLQCGLGASIKSIQAMAWQRNFVFLSKLEGRMRSFLKTGDFAVFGPHETHFRDASVLIEEEVEV